MHNETAEVFNAYFYTLVITSVFRQLVIEKRMAISSLCWMHLKEKMFKNFLAKSKKRNLQNR